MSKVNLPQGVKKHIRREKARIRREFFDPQKQKELIDKLYADILPHILIPTVVKNAVPAIVK